MEKLLTREDFKRLVFARSGGRCVFCALPAVDPHHILERKLFPETGGYFLSSTTNGATDSGLTACGSRAHYFLTQARAKHSQPAESWACSYQKEVEMNTYKNLMAQVPQPGAPINLAWSLDAFPALRLLSATPQDAYYHAEGDVWVHTVMVVTELVNGPDYAVSTQAERFILFYAALLHDVAKSATTVIDPVSGKIGQPGHSRRGAIDARILLWRAGVPFALREAICRIIAVHQLPFFAIAGNKNGQVAEFMIRKLSHELDLRLLAAVAEADMRGRHYDKKADCLVDIELFREMARDEDCFGKPRAFADGHTQLMYFRGAGISPDYEFHQESGSRVIVYSGLPASGKDTHARTNYPSLPVISFDDAREELGLKHGVNAGAAVHLAVDKAKALLREHRPFVWNATHLSNQMRSKSLDLLFAYNAQVELVYLEQPPEVIFSRNTKRDSTLPNKAIERMLFKWEVPLPTEAHSVRYEANPT